ncbi:MAG: DUF2231 domain-containing protein [Candidatus Marinimicrobia bacterium]|jgi:uncharacterized membrane protein|nr:DUF2231 domain-containing protein [Candidatus Neomarinimicrobiota bacterium]MDP7036960.1 DUF2231 domain-containing protein [Candidatus Neomarinimicrobiota bacterium]|tara:strand:- start:611 stop:1027 length:417 start_codon:yes stop_codon:yes gene_type:complete
MEITAVHPLFIHFPIALLSCGYLFDILFIVSKKDEFESVGWWNLCLGMISSFFSLITGFIADWEYGHFENPFPVFDTHGSTQLISVLLFTVMIVWRWRLNKNLPKTVGAVSGYLLLGACATGLLFYGGHLGAILAGRL